MRKNSCSVNATHRANTSYTTGKHTRNSYNHLKALMLKIMRVLGLLLQQKLIAMKANIVTCKATWLSSTPDMHQLRRSAFQQQHTRSHMPARYTLSLTVRTHTRSSFKIFDAAPQENRGVPAKKPPPDYFL